MTDEFDPSNNEITKNIEDPVENEDNARIPNQENAGPEEEQEEAGGGYEIEVLRAGPQASGKPSDFPFEPNVDEIDLDDLPSKKKKEEEEKKKNYNELLEAEKLKQQIRQQQKTQAEDDKTKHIEDDDLNEEELAGLNPFNDEVFLEKQDETTRKVKKVEKKRKKTEQALLKKRKLSMKELLLATIVFSGLQFGWALQIAMLTPFVIELGMPKELSSLVWLCGPVAGLVVQPLVGGLSDGCTFRWGRRRPFIVLGGLMIIAALFVIPNSLDIGSFLGDTHSLTEHSNPVALCLAVVGFWLLDIANNMVQGPCRALIADIAPSEQQGLGSAVFSVWLAVGNVTGYLAGFINFSSFPFLAFNKTKSCSAPCQNLRVAFTISIIFFVATMILTLIYAKETPLGEIDGKKKKKRGCCLNCIFFWKKEKTVEDVTSSTAIVEKKRSEGDNENFIEFMKWIIRTFKGLFDKNRIIELDEEEEETIAKSIIPDPNAAPNASNPENAAVGTVSLEQPPAFISIPTESSLLNGKNKKPKRFNPKLYLLHKITRNGIFLLIKRIFTLPWPMMKVCIVQFFSWFGWFAFLIYSTEWVAENIFHGRSMPEDKNNPINVAFEEGARWGSLGLAGFAIVSLVFSLFVPVMMKFLGSRIVWAIGQICLALSLFGTAIVWEKYGALLLLSSFGISWSITMCVPFALAANIAPEEEKGIYMGILNIFVVLPQLAMSALGPFLISIFWNNLVACFVAGSLSCFLSAILMIFLDSDKKIEKRRLRLIEARTKKLIEEGKIETAESVLNAMALRESDKDKKLVNIHQNGASGPELFVEQDVRITEKNVNNADMSHQAAGMMVAK